MKSIWVTVIYLAAGPLMDAADRSFWQLDFDSDRTSGIQNDKLILMYFTGSDWCQWCNKLDNELFGSEVFQEGIEELAMGLILDFPQRRTLPPKQERHNRRLKAQMQVKVIPEVILYDPDQEAILWRHSYFTVAPEEYLKVGAAQRAQARDER